MEKRLLFTVFLISITSIIYGQINPMGIRQKVLRKNIIGREFIFNNSKWVPYIDNKYKFSYEYDSTVLKYLGTLKTKTGRVLKVLTSKWYFGSGLHGSTRILVFDNKNKYLGEYYLTMTNEVPKRIENNRLIFSNRDKDDCDRKLITRISFYSGIPKQFFVRCKGEFGDVYTFGSE